MYPLITQFLVICVLTSPPQEAKTTTGPRHVITVTATRFPTEINELGQSVTVVNRTEIEAMGASTIRQVLETVAGLSVTQGGSFGGAASVFARGGESNFNLVMIDGVQVNQPGGGFDFADLTTTNVERIEIVRGPSSVLYGSDAVTSTIHIITRKGEGPPSGFFRLDAGSFETRRLETAVQGGTDRVRYSLGGLISDNEGVYAFNNEYDRGSLTARGDFDLSERMNLSTSLRFVDSEYHFPTDFTGQVVDPNDFQQNEEFTYSVALENWITDNYRTQVRYGFHRRDFASFTLADDRVDFFDSTFRSETRRNYLDWQNDLRVHPGHLLTAGLSYEREASDVLRETRRGLGVYLQDQFQHGALYVTAGIRFEENDRFEDFLTGSLAANYQLAEEWNIRGSAGNSFRAPDFIGIIGIPDFGILGNPSLQPEKNVAFDAGLDFREASGKSGLSLTVFFNRFSDLIEFTFATPPGGPNFLNIEEARSQGVELEAFFRPLDNLRLGGQYTLTETEVTDSGTTPGGDFTQGEDLLRRPRNFLNLFVQWLGKHHRSRIDFKFKGKREDFRFFPDFSSSRVVLPSYWKVDFGVTFPLAFTADEKIGLSLLLRGENLLDSEYQDVAGFPSPGRRLTGGFQIDF